MSSQQSFVSFSAQPLKSKIFKHKEWQKTPTVQQTRRPTISKNPQGAVWLNEDATRVCSFHWSLWRLGGLGSLFVQQISSPPRLLWSIGSIWQPVFFLIAGGLGSTIEYVQSTSNTLPKTNIAPENGWLEDYILLGFGLCSRAMLVLGMVTKFKVLFGVDT